MQTSIAARIKALQKMSIPELMEKYQELYGKKSSAANKSFLLKKIAWKIQELEYGGLSEEVKQRALEIAGNMNLHNKLSTGVMPRSKKNQRKVIAQTNIKDHRLPMPGTILTREYKRKSVNVEVLDDGFEYDGRKFRSLSAVAKAVTGSHWNGFLFFRVK